MTSGPLSKFNSASSSKLVTAKPSSIVGRRWPLMGALVCGLMLSSIAAYVLTYRPSLKLFFVQTVGNSSQFIAKDPDEPLQFLRITRFVISTAKFGNLDSVQFESRLSDPGRSISREQTLDFKVDAPSDSEEYLCSSLRSVGFFAKYGTMKEGRLLPNEQPRPARVAQVIKGLTCRFNYSNRSSSDDPDGRWAIGVPCTHVDWIFRCVSEVLPPDN